MHHIVRFSIRTFCYQRHPVRGGLAAGGSQVVLSSNGFWRSGVLQRLILLSSMNWRGSSVRLI
jgi:hypothetical protein